MFQSDHPKAVDGIEIIVSNEGCLIQETAKDRVHFLNVSAGYLLSLCNGVRSREDLTAQMTQAYKGAPVSVEDVAACLDQLANAGLIFDPKA